MFSTNRQLATKTGPDGIGRYDFLKSLVDEFRKTSSLGKCSSTNIIPNK